jgi:predicted metalloprotease with PDZ domain
VAGDFRLLTRDTGNAQLNVAIRGDWEFGDNAFANDLRDVVNAIREFWREEGLEPYLVTLIPIHRAEGQEDAVSWGGTGLSDSFALFATTNVALEDFQNLAAHEFQHRWTPSSLGDIADPEEALYWFSEGFTDYYASLLSLRGGLIDLQGYADQVNKALRDYYRSPAREAPVERVIEWFWSDRDLQRLPYLRGRFLAARWNAEIMAASGGTDNLDNVLFDLLDAAGAASAIGETRELHPGDIVNAAMARRAATASDDHQAYVVSGTMVPIEQGMFGPCFDVQDTVFPPWDIGFDAEASFNAQVVTGVREGGPAWEAGIRDGMPFGGWSIPDYGNPDTDATFYVGINGEAVPITYKPQGEGGDVIPQLVLPEDLSEAERETCLAWLGAGQSAGETSEPGVPALRGN